MKKKFVSIILVGILLVTLLIGQSQAAEKHNEYQYDVLADGTVEIVQYYQPMSNAEHVIIPETIEGYTVTSIGRQAFNWCGATTIVIPDTVTTIKKYAFNNCSDLKSIKLSKNLKVIEDYAFYANRNLERIQFPDGLLEIGEQVFFGCVELDSVIVPNSLQTVKWQAFSGCKAIDNVYYKGTKSEWDALDFFKDNVANLATVHYDFNLQPGDMNGDGINNMLDALYLYASVSGQMELAPVYLMLADVDYDARVNTMDSLMLYGRVSGT
ncbi:MAG: leucine-rich repeat protein [Clostridia bacterium]|nr:leucine-rich repeat protein [Clostridia bacterium]